MDFSVIIPARYASTRLPGKPLLDLAGKPLIQHVVDQARLAKAKRVIVATDDERIAKALENSDCEVCMTRDDHQSGSDRLAEVVETLQFPDQHIVVNVQGDEPLIPPALIDSVARCLHDSASAAMATMAQKISSIEDMQDPNVVKVVFNKQGRALYFSRSAIPYKRQANQSLQAAWHHIGIYAYRCGFLKRYASLQASEIEQLESLEQLRVLDNGETIMVQTTDIDAGIGVDTQQDLERVRLLLEQQK